jgi:3-deoxy-D-manno-octulosonic acid (KDO) 8-phosphate synthase
MNWYVGRCSTQGLVLEETTGRTIAVSFDSANAKLIAQAPAMREALRATAELARDLMARATRADQLLCAARGYESAAEVCEVVQMRAQLSRNAALIAETTEPVDQKGTPR